MKALSNKEKVTGLYFGSFNPINIGHLIIANHMIEWAGINEVWLVVSPRNPLKNKRTLLEDHHRLAIANIAVEDNPKIKTSNIEFKLLTPSYTINTLIILAEKYPNREFALIMGSDNLQNLYKWKNYEKILEDYRIFVYPRPGFDGGIYREHAHIKWVDAPLMQISSTYIREAIRNGKSVKYLLPEKVNEYILEMHFYKKK
jgi:nicotinate-nucleotide adenylyltransferase